MKIVITGSLGNVGKPLTKNLIEKGYTVIVISSQDEKRKEIEELGAIPAIGSLDDADFLTETFTGADAVYCMIPPNFKAINQIEHYRNIGNSYAKAIQQSGVKRVVHLSSYGAHLDKGTGFILGSNHVEAILNELVNVKITHLRPTYFYINLYSFIDMIKNAGFIGANYGGEDKLLMVHPTDIATVAAAELLITDKVTDVRYIASDEITGNEMAKILGTAIGKPDLKWIVFSDEQMQENMEKKGIPAHLIKNFVEMGSSTHSGVMREDYDLHKPEVLGSVEAEDFAKEFAIAYQ